MCRQKISANIRTSLNTVLQRILVSKGYRMKTLCSGRQAENVKTVANISKAEKAQQ